MIKSAALTGRKICNCLIPEDDTLGSFKSEAYSACANSGLALRKMEQYCPLILISDVELVEIH